METTVYLNNIEIGETDKYNYLGTTVNNREDQEGELNNRLGKARRLPQSLERDFLNNKHISKKTKKLTMYKMIYIPTLTFGCGNWIQNERQKSTIRTAEMRYLRKLQGVQRINKLRNVTIRDNLKVQSLIHII